MTLGMKLCNPFDLELNTHIVWEGQVTPPGLSKIFCQFESMFMGLRAGYIDIKNSISEGYNTVEKFVGHYAPPTENDTAAYIKAVSQHLQMGATETLQLAQLKELGVAVLVQEQGSCQFSDSILSEAVAAALSH